MKPQAHAIRFAVFASVVLATGTLSSQHALAGGLHGPESWSFTVGGSVGAYVHDSFSAASITIEGTVAYPIAAPYFYFWMSGGLRTALSKDHQVLFPYVEAGFWFLVNVGVGYSGGFNDRLVSPHNVNLFVGIPFAIPGIVDGPVVLEPYYRLQSGVGARSIEQGHEFGLMVKWWYQLPHRPVPKPDDTF